MSDNETEYQEGPESTFTHEGRVYYVDTLLDMTRSNPVEAFPVSKLEWMNDFDKADPARVYYSDLRVPIIVAQYEPDHYVALDGFHRTVKAIVLGLEFIPARVLTMEQYRTLLTLHVGDEPEEFSGDWD